jgi:hypothetical protein
MPTDVALPAPRGTRRDAALTAPQQVFGLGVVHVGHSAIVLGAERHLVPVTAPDRWLVPGGFQVTDEDDWTELRDLARRASATGWSVSCVTWLDDAVPCPLTVTGERAVPAPAGAGGRPPHVPAAPVAERAAWLADWSRATPHGTPAALDELRGPLLPLAATVLAEEPGALARLVGAGPGTTPTGDDLVVGILAGLHATGDLARAVHLGDELLGLLPRTTRASRHELAAAVDGRFGEALLDLVAELTTPEPHEGALAAAAARLATWGASSGRDQAHGAALAAAATTDPP